MRHTEQGKSGALSSPAVTSMPGQGTRWLQRFSIISKSRSGHEKGVTRQKQGTQEQEDKG